MRCGSVSGLLPLLVEGDLPAADAADLRAHLDGCPACREREAALRQSQAWLRAAAASEPAPPFDEAELAAIRASVLRRVERAAAPTSPLAWLSLTAILLAALLLAVLPARLARVPAPAGPIERATLRPAASSTPLALPAPPAPPARELVASAVPPPAPRALRRARPVLRPVPVEREPSVAADAAAAPSVLRLELQTPNPNVRIIWFVNDPS